MHPLGVQNGGGRSNRDQFCPALRYRPVCRVFWRSARQCLRRERDHGRIGLEDEGGGSSCGSDHRCANPVFRHSLRAGFVDGGSHRISVRLPMLHLSRQCRRAGYCDGQADLEELHHPRVAASDKAECHGDPTLWSVWRGGVVSADHRYPASGALCRDRQQLLEPPGRYQRCGDRARPQDRAKLWHRQATPNDSYVVGCYTDRINCPDDNGPDHDFGQSPILVTLADGQRLLVIGQKSGVVHALDPDQEGKILWQTRVGAGGPLGGIMWGSAADQDHVYVANSDVWFDGYKTLNPNAGGGLFALDLATGKISMQVPPVPCGSRSQCSPALSAAVTAIPGVVFSGGVSGHLRAYATDDARLLWEVDTAREYPIVNGVSARGGAMDGPGPTIVDGMLYVNSGYAQWGGLPGNVLLAFEVG